MEEQETIFSYLAKYQIGSNITNYHTTHTGNLDNQEHDGPEKKNT